ncbi:MAG: FHA domain-containing protein [Salinivirgaceae bacterium]|nr:FHA domain-containing protein [Salinivirgaceae bacterium]
MITIGRASDNNIVIDAGFDDVSEHHATISRTGDNYYFFEDHSSNGSFINNQTIHNQTIIIKHGDKIQLSPTCSIMWQQVDALLDNEGTKQPNNSNESTGNASSQDKKEPVSEQNAATETFKPECVGKFNWGAFWFPGLWGFFNNIWWLLGAMIIIDSLDVFIEGPNVAIISVVIRIVIGLIYGFSGNETVWKQGKVLTKEAAIKFDKKQRRWNTIGLIVGIPTCLLLFLMWFM